MPLIQCSRVTETTVAGETYAFEMDEYGRAVAKVHNPLHVNLLLAVEHYKEIPAIPGDENAPADMVPVPSLPGVQPVTPPRDPLDHDNDGRKGGSRPGAKRKRG